MLFPIDDEFADAQVSTLINLVTKKWDLNILNHLFDPRDVDLIQSIPLCWKPTKDKLFWPHNQSDLFTMKLAYKFLA